MASLQPPLSLDGQLDLLHRNLRPDIGSQVKRREADDMATFLRLCLEAEDQVERNRAYRPPPPAYQSEMPCTAYHPPPRNQPRRMAAVDDPPSVMPPQSRIEGTLPPSRSDPPSSIPLKRRNPPPSAARRSSPSPDQPLIEFPPDETSQDVRLPATLTNPNTLNRTVSVIPPLSEVAPRQPPAGFTSTPFQPSLVTCFNCRRRGHSYPNCSYPLGQFCRKCGMSCSNTASCPACSTDASGNLARGGN